MVDLRKRLHRETVAQLIRDFPGCLPTTIPNASVVEHMGLERLPVGVYAPSSAAAAAFRSLWQDVAARIWT